VSQSLPNGRPGDWAELSIVVLEPAERASGLPPETASTPLAARVRGFLESAAAVGEAAAVRTLAGRRVEGTIVRLNPAAGHSFGEPVSELLPIGGELRSLVLDAISDSGGSAG
jgi:2-amino-4-ketopentanoate thiolase alpha subunit